MRNPTRARCGSIWRRFERFAESRNMGQIALHLEDAHGLKLSIATVFKFFKRATSGRVPLGFSNTEATRDLQKPNPAPAEVRQPAKPFEELGWRPVFYKNNTSSIHGNQGVHPMSEQPEATIEQRAAKDASSPARKAPAESGNQQ